MAFSSGDIARELGQFFTVETVGVADIEANLEEVTKHIQRWSSLATEYAAKYLLTAALHQVPYDEGHLYDSGHVANDTVSEDRPEWSVIFDAVYAAAVHEIPKNYQQGKGPYPDSTKKWKYLEDPAKVYTEVFPQVVAGYIKEGIAAAPIRGLSSGAGAPRLVKRS